MDNRFLEELMWTSYRYCIGRHSYVVSMASDIGRYFYDRLSDERKEFTAIDIRREIEESLKFYSFHFNIDWSIPESEKRPMEMLLGYFNEHGYDKDIDKITCYKDKDGKIEYEVSKVENSRYKREEDYEGYILDFLPWMDLASLFDKKNHRVLRCKGEDGKEEDIEVYESWINDSIEERVEGNMVVLKKIPWRYKKVYRPVKYGVSNRYLEEKYIVADVTSAL